MIEVIVIAAIVIVFIVIFVLDMKRRASEPNDDISTFIRLFPVERIYSNILRIANGKMVTEVTIEQNGIGITVMDGDETNAQATTTYSCNEDDPNFEKSLTFRSMGIVFNGDAKFGELMGGSLAKQMGVGYSCQSFENEFWNGHQIFGKITKQ